MKISTRDKIIQAAVELVSEKGYKGATTKEVASRAGVNEVTIFRHFGNKRGVLEAAIEKYGYSDSIELALNEKIVWNLETDLKMIAREYQNLVEQKKTLILLSLKEAGEFPELNALTRHIPQKYTHLLEKYFETMQVKGKIKSVDISVIAMNFIFMNFGFFLLKSRMGTTTDELSLEAFIENNIHIFIQTLQ